MAQKELEAFNSIKVRLTFFGLFWSLNLTQHQKLTFLTRGGTKQAEVAQSRHRALSSSYLIILLIVSPPVIDRKLMRTGGFAYFVHCSITCTKNIPWQIVSPQYTHVKLNESPLFTQHPPKSFLYTSYHSTYGGPWGLSHRSYLTMMFFR